MPRDPVCGKTVDKSTPFQEELEGKTYFFCGEECQDEFDFNFEEYVEPISGGLESQD